MNQLDGWRVRILYLTQYYPPEIGATQTRAVEMAANLVQQGHSVTVLTEFPNHPKGEFPPHYRKKWFERKRENGIDVLRLWVFARRKKNFVTRMLFYLSYMVAAFIAGSFLRKRYDIVYATSPPLFVAVAGYALSAVKRTRFMMEVRDLWPESAVVLGELSNPFFISWSEKLEWFLYQRAISLVVVTRGIHQRLLQRGLLPQKLYFIPNGANTDMYQPKHRDRKLLQSVDIDPEKFIVVYTGLLGLIHGLDFVLLAAKKLMKTPDILFLFIGDGVQKEKLINKAQNLGVGNVCFLEAQAESRLPAFIQSSNAGLVTTKKIDLCKGTLPVKMFSYMACAKPVLLCVQGEARDLIEQSGAGICIEPEHVDELVQGIYYLRRDADRAENMGQKGRAFVRAHYSRRSLALELEKAMQNSIH